MSVRRARVKSAYATVSIIDPASGIPTVRGFYEGAVFPEAADPVNVASLVRRGYAEWLDSDDAEAVAQQEDDVEQAQQEAAEKRAEEAEAAVKAADELAAESATTSGPPAANAPKAEWVAYAVSQRAEGVSEADAQAEAEGKTKADLIAEFGS